MTPQLILAPTLRHAAQVKRDHPNPLSQSLTLVGFIDMLYERHGAKRPIDTTEAAQILGALLKRVPRVLFDYLTPEAEALETIVSYMIATKRNGVEIEAFEFEPAKEKELEKMLTHYNIFLKRHGLADAGDVEKEVLKLLQQQPEICKPYGKIIIDAFESNGVHYESSALQAEILAQLIRLGGLQYERSTQDVAAPRFFAPHPAPFDQVDEVASALKIARRLLEDGVKAESLVIVASAVDLYAPIFDALLNTYGLSGYSTKGVPLRHYMPLIETMDTGTDDPMLIEAANALTSVRTAAKRKQERLHQLGIDVEPERLLDSLIDRTSVRSSRRAGIMITEPNQLLALDRIEHLIFVGTDMDHFPPRASENYLVTAMQKESLLHGNSLYRSSYNHYQQMKRVAENLYIVTASYKAKTPLSRSMLITEHCEPFDISGYKSAREWPVQGKWVQKKEMAPYLGSLRSDELTQYDGMDVGHVPVKVLSASKLNSYAMCPRRYFFDQVLKLQPAQKMDEGFDVMEQGNIMHQCYERFARAVKAKEITLGSHVSDSIQKVMKEIAIAVYTEYLNHEGVQENVMHRLYLQDLMSGLDHASDDPGGVLQNFLIYVTQHRTLLDHFSSSEFEMFFGLDAAFNPTDDKQKHFIRGFIDRIDLHETRIRIVDYKSKKADSIDTKKIEQMQTFKDMQLPLYTLFARRRYNREVESVLHTFRSRHTHLEFAKAATFEQPAAYLHYDDEYEDALITRIKAIKTSIESGDFRYDDSDETYCGWCGYALMCHRKAISWEEA